MPSFSRTRTEAEFSVSHQAQILRSFNWSKPNERRALPTSVAYPLPQDPLLRKYPMYACPIILARSSLLPGSVTHIHRLQRAFRFLSELPRDGNTCAVWTLGLREPSALDP